ncbi:probable E3 SUMO-protein ligase RNF212 isoform X2 [Maniola jurtina]|uniref:probable E3 SUMO-protein ligase RNF212 isoform X2 n=1 Tax=Maniola jurtina TaxID=191418 RepID=UPI001E68E4E1|nr:probable E3 SUMO-protein ligase RNF212 isoform X2 [Maniola jurtina]
MDWIHCNNCITQLEPGITLHLTSCGHMFCNNCLNNGLKEGICLVCKVPCSIMKLAPDMNQEIQDYFTDPDDLLKKCCEVLEFQRRHRRRLLSYLLQSTKKFYAARTELKRMTELCQKQHKQIKEYQKMFKRMETQNSTLPRQTSPFNVPISPGNNISPGYIQSTPTYKRPAKSTPYSKSNNSNKISSTVFTPPAPESAGLITSQDLFLSQSSTQSNDSTRSWKRSPITVLQWVRRKM